MAAVDKEAASQTVDAVQFGFYSPEEIRNISVKKITKPDLLDQKGVPVPDGLYDLTMGPFQNTDSCKTCGQLESKCPGHCGHIEFVKPVYNPLLFNKLKSLLNVVCFFCHKFRFGEDKVKQYAEILTRIAKGDVLAAKGLEASAIHGVFLSEGSEGESDIKEMSPAIPCELATDSEDVQKNTWTSLQYAEAISVISFIMKSRSNKCANCGKKNPKISSPTFGWLSKTVKDSDIRANFIRESNVGLPFADGDRQADAGGDDASQNDEELSAPTNVSQQVRDLPPEFFERLYSSSGQRHLLPSEAELILEGLWRNEPQLCNLICNIQQNKLKLSMNNKAYTMFFLKALLIPPSKFRPPAFAVRGVVEHPQNRLLSKVQESNIAFRDLITIDPDNPNDTRKWMDLQRSVTVLFDSSKGLAKSDRETNGIRQLLEKKAGVLRQKMMGKRVNYACRSVISPDPYLAVNEIGIPPYFALKLTYPERVTPWNVNKLRHAIINGADIHPGASHFMDKDRIYKLQGTINTRNAISRKLPTSRGGSTKSRKGPEYDFEGKVVYRHLQDGDIVLVNRQPTLHKPSMMAHVVRVLNGEKTLRMHYANCSTYNADFDGDEMNVHLPQDEVSQAEAINIVNANKQYIVPTSGDPIRGLIQDHIVSAVLLCKLDTFLTREEYHQLLYASSLPPAAHSGGFGQKVSALSSDDEIKPLPPAIWKPKPLWTGKQVITAILCHITRGRSPFSVEKDGRIPKEYFSKGSKEYSLRIYNNEFIHGMIDKAQFGKFGLVHIVHELYGADTAGRLLSIFSRLFTTFLQMHAFTCGVDDLLLKRESDMDREAMLEKSEAQSEDVHCRFTGAKCGNIDPLDMRREIEKVIRSNGESAAARLDRMMSNALNVLTSEVNKALFPAGLQKPFPANCLSLMTTTGAKGGLVNLTQISSLLGQQELEGKRVPRMISGKTLPCFPPWDTSCRAGGFISDRFLTALRPQEYYFHCMAGRDGLVDTAIKTSRSGYLQRCLIKNLECLKVCYDYTVRDADGSVVQFAYGEDGVDVLKTSYIAEAQVLLNNQRAVLESLGSGLEDAHLSKSNRYIKELPDSLREIATNLARQLTHSPKSERGYCHQIKRKNLMKLMKLKYLSSLAEPGEPVGVVAAQSVGEPSTQMTLNTFHLAGRGEMNVTLGIPRLTEILMSAKEAISTPIMTCPLLDGMTKEQGEGLAAKLRRICVADIIESMEVSTLPFYIHNRSKTVSTLYKLKMKLFPPGLYPPHVDLSLEHCRSILSMTFVNALGDAIAKHLDLISKISDIGVLSNEGDTEGGKQEETGSKSADGEDNDAEDGGVRGGEKDDDREDDDVDDNEDLGADGQKRRNQAHDEMEYEDDFEKKTSVELDDETRSGFGSDIDQADAEAEDDYEVRRDDFVAEADERTPENDHGTVDDDEERPTSPSRTEHTPMTKAGKTKAKTKRVKSRNAAKFLIFVDAKGLKFEAHFLLTDQPHILLAEIAQATAKRVYVRQCKDIDRCSVVEPKRSTDRAALQTAGVNFVAFWDLQDKLDINRIVTNDIHAMLNTYGVEAARATIINEVKGVFEPYGIRVNTRHLSLIADFMCSHGGYRPMNRLGMMDFNTSPFCKMTYETATRFIVEAAFHGERDTLESPSASVSLGQLMKYGTGAFDLLQNL